MKSWLSSFSSADNYQKCKKWDLGRSQINEFIVEFRGKVVWFVGVRYVNYVPFDDSVSTPINE